MSEPILFSEDFEAKLCAAVRQPEPDPAFVARLHSGLRSARRLPPVERIIPPWWRRPAFALTTALVLALLAVFVAAGPRKVLAAVQSWLGSYIPSFGYVQDASDVRAILAPVLQERGGGVMTVDAAFTDGERTIVVIGESHSDVPCPRPVDQMDEPFLTAGETRFDLESWKASRLIFPALPAGVGEVTLHMPWMLFCDTDQAEWTIPLRFQPVPPGMALPVLDEDGSVDPAAVSTVTAPVSTTQLGASPVPAPDVSLELGQVVELEDGFLLSGLLRWQGDTAWYSLPAVEETTVLDATGRALPVEALSPDEVWTLYPSLPPNAAPWALKVVGKDRTAPFTVSFPYLLRAINPVEQPTFELDLGADPRVGQIWTPDLTVAFEGHRLRLVEVHQVDEAGKVLAFIFEADQTVEFVTVGAAGETSGGGGGTAELEPQPGRLQTIAYFNQVVTTGRQRFSIVSLQERLTGPWQVQE